MAKTAHKLTTMLSKTEQMDNALDCIMEQISREKVTYDTDDIDEDLICEMYLKVIEGWVNKDRNVSAEAYLKAVFRLAKLKGIIDKNVQFEDEEIEFIV